MIDEGETLATVTAVWLAVVEEKTTGLLPKNGVLAAPLGVVDQLGVVPSQAEEEVLAQ